MNAARMREFYQFHHWANGEVRSAVSRLTSEQFTKELGGSFPSVRETVAHLAWVDWIWLQRFRGHSPRAFPSWTEASDFATLERQWLDAEADQRAFVEGVTDDELEKTLAYTNMKGERWQYPLWQALLHVVNHGTYHRGQIVTFLRQLGAGGVSTDLLIYYDKNPAPAGKD
jgi:uncharacterized damage-inducible protein DinB